MLKKVKTHLIHIGEGKTKTLKNILTAVNEKFCPVTLDRMSIGFDDGSISYPDSGLTNHCGNKNIASVVSTP